MKSIVVAALFAAVSGAAHAAFVTEDLSTDPTYLALGVTDTPVAELRWGDAGGAATWEAGVGLHTQQSANFTQRQVNWVADNERAFIVSFDSALSQMSMTLDGLATFSHVVPSGSFDFGNRLALRADGRWGDVSITDLMLNGMSLTDFGSTTAVSYRLIGGLDPSADWTLSGTLSFFDSETGDANRNSRPSFQVKVIDGAPAPVPAPAAVFGLMAALGSLAGLRARRRATA